MALTVCRLIGSGTSPALDALIHLHNNNIIIYERGTLTFWALHAPYIMCGAVLTIYLYVCSHKLYGGREPRRFYHKIILISQEQ